MKCERFIVNIILALAAACSKSTGPKPVCPADALEPGIIVFVSDRETSPLRQLFVMPSDSGDAIRITHDANDYRCPSFSPDGDRILFHSQTSDQSGEIYAVNADGSDLVNLSNAPGDDGFPSYSPDGSRIVFTSSRDGNREIYIMDAGGGNQTRLTFDDGIDGSPQFTGGGARILYYSFDPNSREYGIWIMDTDGGNKTCLTGNELYFQNQAFVSTDAFGAYDARPGLSPDGSRIVFMSYDSEAFNYSIFMMDLDGQHQRLLTDAAGYNLAPVFTPDGQKSLFRSHRGGNYDLYQMDLEGEGQTNLTRGPGHAYFSQFVQDGSKILFFTDRHTYFKIWLMNRDGSGQIQLTFGDYHDYEPCYRPLER